jgi:hypothetical protein
VASRRRCAIAKREFRRIFALSTKKNSIASRGCRSAAARARGGGRKPQAAPGGAIAARAAIKQTGARKPRICCALRNSAPSRVGAARGFDGHRAGFNEVPAQRARPRLARTIIR